MPYPKGEAIGLSFAVSKTTPIPASLRIIKNEIENSKVEIQSDIFNSDQWKELSHWKNQGVFLLNAALTVEALASGSHTQIWQWFTKEVISIISTFNSPIWMLWGAKAKGYISYINGSKIVITDPNVANIDRARYRPGMNIVLEADHPAAETYPGSKYKFSGCNHFNLCNEVLKLKKQSIINW